MIAGYAIVDDDGQHVAVYGTLAEATAHANRHPAGCGHCRQVDEYRAARRAFEARRETVCLGYYTEEGMYGEEHGVMTFKSWLSGNRRDLS